MKSPEEIKMWLVEAMARTFWATQGDDNHEMKSACNLAHASIGDALVYIGWLEAERDALFKEVRGRCSTCKHFDKEVEEEPCASCVVLDGDSHKWEWRGAQKEE